MKKIFFPTLLVFLLVLSNLLHSQSKQNFAFKENWEISGSMSITSTSYVSNGNSGDAVTVVSFSPFLGYFPANGFEVGVIPEVSLTAVSGYSSKDITLYLAPSYNFYTESAAYPYIQGCIGYGSISGTGSSSRSGVAWKLEAGTKVNLFGNSLLKLGLSYCQKNYNQSSSFSTGRSGLNIISFNMGFGIFLK
jgi:hypothetical protein